jgi:hypothetical protein
MDFLAFGESPLDDAIVGLTQELRRRTQEAGEEEEGEGPDGEIALEAKRRPGSGDYRTEHEAHGSNDIGGLRDEQDAQDVHDEHDLQDEDEALGLPRAEAATRRAQSPAGLRGGQA